MNYASITAITFQLMNYASITAITFQLMNYASIGAIPFQPRGLKDRLSPGYHLAGAAASEAVAIKFAGAAPATGY